jgi:hypothetical protein
MLVIMLANRFVVQRTSTPIITAVFLCKSISMLIITLAYQYASCPSAVIVGKVIKVAFYYTGYDAVGILVRL